MKRIRTIIAGAIALAFMAPEPGFAVSATSEGRQANEDRPEIRLAMVRHYQFVNPLPIPVWIKVYGSSSLGFPKVYKTPAPPAPFVPIPYPDISMQIRVKPQGGSWSRKFTVPWRPGPITLRGFLGM